MAEHGCRCLPLPFPVGAVSGQHTLPEQGSQDALRNDRALEHVALVEQHGLDEGGLGDPAHRAADPTGQDDPLFVDRCGKDAQGVLQQLRKE